MQSYDEWLDYARRNGQTTYHVIGTCKMGSDPMAVVDDRLRVHGIAGLRVIDASIMPTVPSGNAAVSVFEVPRPRASVDHPTMKPPELVAQMLRNSTRRGGVVVDPFAGSGSTLVACEQLGRAARLVEIDPAYCDVVVERYERLTGEVAVRWGSA